MQSSKLNIIRDESKPEEPWYAKGLKFSCTQCGKCCTGSPGAAWVTLDEIQRIAEFLNIPINDVVQNYLRKIDGRWALREKAHTYDRIFLKDKKCSIYDARPTQCKTFPWWNKNLESEQSWQQTAAFCEGICDDAPTVPFEEIQKQLKV